MLGRARLDARAQAAERIDVVVELPLGLLGDGADRLVERQAGIFLRRPRVDLVVDVGDVAHIGDVVGAVEMPQQAEQHVEHDDRPRIADMGEVVDGRPAHIHAHAGGIERLEQPLLARERIVELQFHGRLSASWPGVQTSRSESQDGRSQRRSLADNLRANAADMVKAVHAADNGELARARQEGATCRATIRLRESESARANCRRYWRKSRGSWPRQTWARASQACRQEAVRQRCRRCGSVG